jgi:hypothetical protein
MSFTHYPWLPEYDTMDRTRMGSILSFSSFSLDRSCVWGRKLARPLQIVVMPGYRRPDDLATGWKDSMWLDKEIVRPTVVWDGFDELSLFEVIYECFDYRGEGEFIGVFDAATGQRVHDKRPKACLDARPRKHASFSYDDLYPYSRAVKAWALATDPVKTLGAWSPGSQHKRYEHNQRLRLWNELKMTEDEMLRVYFAFRQRLEDGSEVLPLKYGPWAWHPRNAELNEKFFGKAAMSSGSVMEPFRRKKDAEPDPSTAPPIITDAGRQDAPVKENRKGLLARLLGGKGGETESNPFK